MSPSACHWLWEDGGSQRRGGQVGVLPSGTCVLLGQYDSILYSPYRHLMVTSYPQVWASQRHNVGKGV